jgi:hypothetical protein
MPKKIGRPPTYNRAHFKEVADVYLQAVTQDAPPRLAVSEHFNITPSQAAKWIYRCRREPLNLLPPTSRGSITARVSNAPRVSTSNAELYTVRDAMRELNTLIDRLDRGEAEKFVLMKHNQLRAVVLSVDVYAELLRRATEPGE